MRQAMLTTVDNPYDPFDDYDNWYAYDSRNGYHSPGYLARITITSDDLPVLLQYQAIEQAIDEIVEENLFGVYKKVVRDVPEPQSPGL